MDGYIKKMLELSPSVCVENSDSGGQYWNYSFLCSVFFFFFTLESDAWLRRALVAKCLHLQNTYSSECHVAQCDTIQAVE